MEGGSANDYEYVNGDPVNNLDLDGNVCIGNRCLRAPKVNVRKLAHKALTVTSYAAGGVLLGAAIVGTGGTALIVIGGVAVTADVGLAALDCSGTRRSGCGASAFVVGLDAASFGAGRYLRTARGIRTFGRGLAPRLARAADIAFGSSALFGPWIANGVQ